MAPQRLSHELLLSDLVGRLGNLIKLNKKAPRAIYTLAIMSMQTLLKKHLKLLSLPDIYQIKFLCTCKKYIDNNAAGQRYGRTLGPNCGSLQYHYTHFGQYLSFHFIGKFCTKIMGQQILKKMRKCSKKLTIGNPFLKESKGKVKQYLGGHFE